MRPLTPFENRSIDRVEALLQDCSRTEVQERLLRAVRWSGRATAAHSSEEQVLFAMMALECIVKPTRISQVTETVAKRAAGLQALTEADRKAVQKELENLYSQRSAVAHVGALDASPQGARSLESLMRKYSKGAILTLLIDPVVNDFTSFKELTAHLDRFDDL